MGSWDRQTMEKINGMIPERRRQKSRNIHTPINCLDGMAGGNGQRLKGIAQEDETGQFKGLCVSGETRRTKEGVVGWLGCAMRRLSQRGGRRACDERKRKGKRRQHLNCT